MSWWHRPCTAAAVLIRSILLAACVALCTPLASVAQTDSQALNAAAWKHIERGDPGSAARLFAEALTTQPDQPVLLLGAGVAAHMQGRTDAARASLTRALTLDPRLTTASIILGELAHVDGDLAQAVAIYEKALTFAPNDAHLTSRLQAWRADVETSRSFTERRVDRFRVMFQGHADRPLATRATDVLEAAFWRIGRALGAYPSEPVGVTLYTEQQFQDVTLAPAWVGGLYDGRIRVPTSGASQSLALFDRVLVHELTHALIVRMAPRGIPTWLHEGLAQHFEGDDAAAARRRLARTGVIPLRHLEGSFSGLTGAQARVAYDESLVVVDALVRRAGVNWSALFRALAESTRAEYTLDQFGLRYAELEREITDAGSAPASR